MAQPLSQEGGDHEKVINLGRVNRIYFRLRL